MTDFSADEYKLNVDDQEASDVLVATNLAGFSYRSTAIPLTFNHVMSVLHVNINVANFKATPTEAVVKVKAKTTATINYTSQSVTATGDNYEIVLPAIESADDYLFSYKTVMVPQSGIKEITIKVGDQTFAYVPSKGITLRGGCYTTLNMTIKRNEVVLGSARIVDWNRSAIINGEIGEFDDPSEQTDPEIDPTPEPSGELTDLGATFEAVDLGLPSGLRWANKNIGATAPEDFGSYLAWGEIKSKPKNSYAYSVNNYKFYKTATTKDADGYDIVTSSGYTKYCSDSDYGLNGFTDELTTLELCDDVANVLLGGNWRMPTCAELQELYDNCTREWRQLNGVDGFKMTGPNGTSLFLPAAGYLYGDSLYSRGSKCYYWSSLLDEESPSDAWCANIYNDVWDTGGIKFYLIRHSRVNGRTVRPVYSPKQ